ncbi:hematopoietic progenitor cell antigen CD34 [Myripristis murdjan]|uniref:hematopoietic progenitor cell antigen CD34 n=1 Tax=Myripristis murdjan TaxID=586833 RepID=UPI00117616AD|nr:hematopoietic progenitor cell antigen CD34 [Myripristis murdjan]
MAASSAQRPNGPCKMFTLLLVAALFNAGIMAEEEEVITQSFLQVKTEELRGDAMPSTTKSPETGTEGQKLVYPPFITSTSHPAATTPEEGGPAEQPEDGSPGDQGKAADEETGLKVNTVSLETKTLEQQTKAPQPARGDGPNYVPQPAPPSDVICVTKEAVQDKDAVHLKLKAPSNCEDTRSKIASVLQELCGEDCKLNIFQEDNSDEILVSGQYVEDDAVGMAEKFNNDNIKDKTGVEEAVPQWGKNSKLVLVSLLLAGLLLAALLVAGYGLKTHRKNSKGVRLAESFQVDEENQANTLVSVAPLPQEPLDKPTINGESPPENGTNTAPSTNGHSASQTAVADTEM